MFQISGLARRIECQQAQQVANGFIGGVQVQPDILLDTVEELFTARQYDLGRLPVVEKTQQHSGQQQQKGEHHADMDMQWKPAWIRAQWVRHCGFLHEGQHTAEGPSIVKALSLRLRRIA
ncbi:hypothetical protein D3C84_646450 [compost metagenome]